MTLNKGLGTVVADEHIFHIQKLILGEGLLHIWAAAPGPWKYPGGELEYSVHGPDGVLFMSAEKIDMPRFDVSEGGVVHSDFTFSIEAKRGVPVG